MLTSPGTNIIAGGRWHGTRWSVARAVGSSDGSLDTHTVLLLLLLPLDLDVLLDRFVWVHYICIIAWVKLQMPCDFCISSFGELELMRTKAFSG